MIKDGILNLDSFVELCKLNLDVKFAITGSLMLHMQGVKLNRIPNDVDIVCDRKDVKELQVPSNWDECTNRKTYDNPEMSTFSVAVPGQKSTKVDIMYSDNPGDFITTITPYTDLAYFADFKTMLYAKARFAMQNNKAADKHMLDLISLHYKMVDKPFVAGRSGMIDHVMKVSQIR